MSVRSALRQTQQRVSKLIGHLDTTHGPKFLWAVRTTGFVFSAYCLCQLLQHHVVTYTATAGPSMYPTMPAERSYAIVSRLHRRGRNVHVGDVVHALNPNFLHRPVGKRIIGMPGDYVVADKRAPPTVGGAPMPGIVPEDPDRPEPLMMRVPEGHVWVAGDNMAHSRDSRLYGPLPMALIQGKIIASVKFDPFSWFGMARTGLVEADSGDSLSAKAQRAQVLNEIKMKEKQSVAEEWLRKNDR